MKKSVIIMFLIVTIIFIYQHSTGLSWDFLVYHMNAHYFLTGTGFYERGRPPLSSLLMIFGDYSYIIIVSLITLIACDKFSKKFGFRTEVFYSLLMTPFVILNGLSVGTELLSLALTLLVFSYRDDELGGFFYGLSVLTHYGNIVNGFLLINRDWKKMIKSLIVFFLVIAPWLLFNQAVNGHPFYSFADQYANNILMRKSQVQPFSFNDFFMISGLLTPLFLVGLLRIKKSDYLMLLFFFVRFFYYFNLPTKIVRYFFLITIPVVYFSAKAINNFKRLWVLFFIASLVLTHAFWHNLDSPSIYLDSLNHINKSCMVLSNNWVYLNYLGVNAGPAPRYELLDDKLNDGYTLVLYKWIKEPSYVNVLSGNVYDDDYYLIISEGCKPSYYYNGSYISELNDYLQLHNDSITVDSVIRELFI